VTPLIQAGDNVLAVRLGDGWYTGNVGFWGRQRYGHAPAVLSQLECELAGGELQTRRSHRATRDMWGHKPGVDRRAQSPNSGASS